MIAAGLEMILSKVSRIPHPPIRDSCMGTCNFVVDLIRRIPKAKLEEVYKHRPFANEIMLLFRAIRL